MSNALKRQKKKFQINLKYFNKVLRKKDAFNETEIKNSFHNH